MNSIQAKYGQGAIEAEELALNKMLGQSTPNNKTNNSTEVHQKWMKEKEKQLVNVSFEIKRDENLSPYDISFEDYQYLTYDALKTIFDENTQELADAEELRQYSTKTNDKILNEIYHDKLKETKSDENWDGYLHSMMSLSIFDLRLPGQAQGELLFQPISQNGYNITKENLFKGFDMFKDSLNDPNRSWKFDIEATLKAMDEIKEEYHKRVAQNESLLQEYTKNNKPNPLDTIEEQNG